MPLHPAIVHFPIALLITGWVLFLVGHWQKTEKGWGFSAWVVLLAGTIMLLPALLSGSQAEEAVAQGTAAAEVVHDHEIMAYITTWLALMLAGWSTFRRTVWKGYEQIGFLALYLLLVAILTYTAFLGGSLVYEHGVGVTPASLQAS